MIDWLYVLLRGAFKPQSRALALKLSEKNRGCVTHLLLRGLQTIADACIQEVLARCRAAGVGTSS